MNELQVIEYKDIRVLTTQQLAEKYETDSKTLSNNFNRNKNRYKEGKHYILLQGQELREFKTSHQFDESLMKVNQLYLWTEKGCLLHAKSLGTDKAWEVYERLVDTYFIKQKPLSLEEMMRIQLGMVDGHEKRISNLENNMTIDYGQQQVVKKRVNEVVIKHLGGKGSNAYKEMSKVVFSECNRDIQDYFNVNSRNNIPKLRFEEAIKYILNWQPCTNTKIQIQNCNNQLTMSID